MYVQVDEALIPSLSSFLPRSKPFIGLGTTKAEMPLCFKLLSVVAMTIAALLSYPLVIQHLVPFNSQRSPFNFAAVEAAPASDPFPGSERAKLPILEPKSEFTSDVHILSKKRA